MIAVGAPWWWATLFAPALMLVFILKITGIPPTERRALKSRGEDYRRYQRTTSAFLPWPPDGAVVKRWAIRQAESRRVPDALAR